MVFLRGCLHCERLVTDCDFRRMLSLKLSLFVFIAIVVVQRNVDAQSKNDPVRQGQKAFSSQGEWSWYDSHADAVKPVNPPALDSRRGRSSGSDSRGTRSEGKKPSGNRGGSAGQGGDQGGSSSSEFSFPTSSGGFEGLGYVVNVIAWIAVITVLIAVIVGIIWAIMKMDLSKDQEEDETTVNEEVVLAPVDMLPFEIDRSIGNFLDAARQAYERQDYRLATVFTFSHVLLTLNQQNWIRLTRGKTNRQYLAELRGHDELRRYYELVMTLFEAAFFGNQQIPSQRFEVLWSQIDHFHQMVQQRPQRVLTTQMPYRPLTT